MRQGFYAAVACSRVARNSVPSTHMRSMITANRRARATIAFFIPRRLAICSPGFEPGPFLRPQHALSCFVEHDPHHLISAAGYCAGSVDLARLILGRCLSKYRPDRLGVPVAGRYIDGDAIGQLDLTADTADCLQA